jgi:hypothetical protein
MDNTGWEGQPRDILGRPAAVEQFVVRSEHAVVALRQVVAFPSGCLLGLVLAARRGSLPERVWDGLVGSFHELTEAGLRLGVRYPGGAKATTVRSAFPGWAYPTDRPEPPMLVEAGGGSSSDDSDYRGDRELWLWPLPPPGPFEFVVEWPAMGIDLTATTLDGDAITRAAERSEPYWP